MDVIAFHLLITWYCCAVKVCQAFAGDPLLMDHQSPTGAVSSPSPSPSLYCTDWKGNQVPNGYEFIPRKGDACLKCICENGYMVMCTAVQCSPPSCAVFEEVEDACCEFNCIHPPLVPSSGDIPGLNGTRNNADGYNDTSDLGLRLVASTVTSLLILALLLFMIHRLRQRRLLIMMRRLNSEQQEEDAMAYMTNINPVDIGIEFPPYEDPPPPYSPPKPPDVTDGEAPPPYEETPSDTTRNGYLNGDTRGLAESSGGRSVRERERPHNSPDLIPMERIRREDSSENSRLVERETLRGNSANRSEDHESTGRLSDKYGLSVAVAGQENSSSPSHVLVQMHNNSPRSSLLRTSTDAALENAIPGLLAQNGSSPLLTYIKKSDSMEIKRGSDSPRNSFYADEGENADINANPREPSSSREIPTLSSFQSGTKSKRPPGKPFRIKDGFPFGNPQSKDRPSSLVSRGSSPLVSYEESRRSLPPLELLWSNDTNSRTVSKEMPLNNTSCAVPVNITTSTMQCSSAVPSPMMTDSTGSSLLGACGGSASSTSNSQVQSPSSLSPQSPSHNIPDNRSGSINSHLSVFSVCSETGERKLPKPPAGATGALRNDVQYPLSPLTSMHTAPIPASLCTPSDNDSCVDDPADFRNGLFNNAALTRYSDGCENPSQKTPGDSHPNESYNLTKNQLHTPAYRKVIYCDPEELEYKSSPVDNPDEESSMAKDLSYTTQAHNTRSKVKRSEMPANDKKTSKDKGISKKKEANDKSPNAKTRRRRSNCDSPGRSAYIDNGAVKEPLGTYKQYGFIDAPDVLKGLENVDVVPADGDHVHRSPPEHTKKREGSGERRGKKSRDNSKERSLWKDGQRSRSSSGKRESPGNQRRKRRSFHRDQQQGVENGVNGDIPNGVDTDYHVQLHKSRSPNRRRRKCQSMGDRDSVISHYPHVDNEDHIASRQARLSKVTLDNAVHLAPSGESTTNYRISETKPHTDNYLINTTEPYCVER